MINKNTEKKQELVIFISKESQIQNILPFTIWTSFVIAEKGKKKLN